MALYVALCPRRQRFRYTCQRVERSSAPEILFFALPLCLFRDWVGDGKICRYLFTISGGALGFHAGGSEEQTAWTFFPIALPPFSFHGLGGEGERSLDETLLGRAAYLVCMTAGWESECAKKKMRFHGSVLIDGWVGGKESQRLSTTSGGALSIHAAGSGMQARGTFEPFPYSSLKFHGLGAGEERGAGGSYFRR